MLAGLDGSGEDAHDVLTCDETLGLGRGGALEDADMVPVVLVGEHAAESFDLPAFGSKQCNIHGELFGCCPDAPTFSFYNDYSSFEVHCFTSLRERLVELLLYGDGRGETAGGVAGAAKIRNRAAKYSTGCSVV